mmetsp:Transcript_16012/g.44452  ORF Transcript_16012/g.44452 Transcript_16012/m.44452 type:complete len:293 (+) Transcript_16012:2-880(+)
MALFGRGGAGGAAGLGGGVSLAPKASALQTRPAPAGDADGHLGSHAASPRDGSGGVVDEEAVSAAAVAAATNGGAGGSPNGATLKRSRADYEEPDAASLGGYGLHDSMAHLGGIGRARMDGGDAGGLYMSEHYKALAAGGVASGVVDATSALMASTSPSPRASSPGSAGRVASMRPAGFLAVSTASSAASIASVSPHSTQSHSTHGHGSPLPRDVEVALPRIAALEQPTSVAPMLQLSLDASKITQHEIASTPVPKGVAASIAAAEAAAAAGRMPMPMPMTSPLSGVAHVDV